MNSVGIMRAALSLEGIGGDAREGFEMARETGFGGIAFATNHKEIGTEALSDSGRRHLRALLGGKHLRIDALRVAGPRGGLGDSATIDRMMEQTKKGILLARDLGVKTVGLWAGDLKNGKVPESTVVAAIRELAQHADASGVDLAVGSDGFSGLAGILKAVDFERARAILDSGKLVGEGVDAVKAAEETAGRIGQWTAADAIRTGRQVRRVGLGEGQVDVRGVAEMLAEQGFAGPVVVDVRELGDVRGAAEEAARVLGPLLGGR